MRCVLLGYLALSLLLWLVAPASAAPPAEKHDEHAGPAAAGHGADAHGEKSENPLSVSADLGIWTIVVFVLLLLILRKMAWKPMLEGLQRREESIRGALEEARRTRDEARRLQGELQARLNKAAEEVREIIEEGRRDAKTMTDDMVAKARGEIQTERERLRREIETARDQALQQIWNQAADLAALVSAKAIRRKLTADDHRRLVDEALSELRNAGSERQRSVAEVKV